MTISDLKLDIKVFKKRTIFVISNIYPSQMLIFKKPSFEIKSISDKCVNSLQLHALCLAVLLACHMMR